MTTQAIKLPDIGEGVTQAEIVEWNVQVGDSISEDEVIGAVMTDKAAVEIPSLYTGKVVWLAGEIGDILAVGADLVKIETAGVAASEAFNEPELADNISTFPSSASGPETKTQVMITPAPNPPNQPPPAGAPSTLASVHQDHSSPKSKLALASPAVRARAKAAQVDLAAVKGTGPAGRITHADLDKELMQHQISPVATRPNRPEAEPIKLVGLRRKIAERMSLANEKIPHITVVEEVDVTELERTRASINEDNQDGAKLTLLPFLVAAVHKALAKHPEMNALYDDETGVVTRYATVNVGIATATEDGLVVPVLRHCETLSVFETSREIARLVRSARTGRASRKEMTGSTITITSLGALGGIVTTPIINYPEVAIVGVNKIAVRPHWDGQNFVPRKIMNLSSSFDHRVIDGWNAAVFIQTLKSLLETPSKIFLPNQN